LTHRGTIRRRLDKRDGFPGGAGAESTLHKRAMDILLAKLALIPGFPEALQFVRKLPPGRYDDAAWGFIEALLAVLPRVAAQLEAVFAQQNTIDFNQATLIALRALESGDAPSDLLLALDTRIEHLLVDEFQDTSRAQVELIERLTAGWGPGDGRT